jgi:hypothetical protein
VRGAECAHARGCAFAGGCCYFYKTPNTTDVQPGWFACCMVHFRCCWCKVAVSWARCSLSSIRPQVPA